VIDEVDFTMISDRFFILTVVNYTIILTEKLIVIQMKNIMKGKSMDNIG